MNRIPCRAWEIVIESPHGVTQISGSILSKDAKESYSYDAVPHHCVVVMNLTETDIACIPAITTEMLRDSNGEIYSLSFASNGFPICSGGFDIQDKRVMSGKRGIVFLGEEA